MQDGGNALKTKTTVDHTFQVRLSSCIRSVWLLAEDAQLCLWLSLPLSENNEKGIVETWSTVTKCAEASNKSLHTYKRPIIMYEAMDSRIIP